MVVITLKDKVSGLLGSEPDHPVAYYEALAKFREVGESIQGVLGPSFKVRLEPGPHFSEESRLGTQYWMMVRSGPELAHALFQVFLPGKGYPATLDLFGLPRARCGTAQDIEASLLAFLANPMVKDRLRMLKELSE
jgi:hypothetical protein